MVNQFFDRMLVNETIFIYQFKPSSSGVLQIGAYYGVTIAAAIGVIAILGLLIRGLFIYYINYKTSDRPINSLVWYEQVKIQNSIVAPIQFSRLTFEFLFHCFT